MATGQMNNVMECLRKAALLRGSVTEADARLVEDYVSRRDEAALAALVRRHASMVWGVCRRILSDHHDAEDAFQATFLVFVRKAASVMPRAMLANWLYGVARQTALNVRTSVTKRKGRERAMATVPERGVTDEQLWGDLRPLLDEELTRLPDKYRAVVVLCDLEGKTRKEVARQLNCPEGTVAGRLARARHMLAKRLTQRGVALTGTALAVLLVQNAASANVPNSLVSGTIGAANLFAAGKAAAVGAISPAVVAATEGVLKAMMISKVKAVVAVVLAFTFIAIGWAIHSARTTAHGAQPALEFPRELLEKKAPDREKKAFTAWGKEVNGLQAGWGFRPGEHRAYHHGETVTLVLRVRATAKLPFSGPHRYAFRFEELPAISDADGKSIPIASIAAERPREPKVELTAGKEIDLYELKLELRPAGESGKKGNRTLYGAGNFQIQSEPVTAEYLGPLLIVARLISKLATGKLELEVKAAEKEEKEAFTAWGKEVGGLQAGLGFRVGEKRAHHYGETVSVVARLRNVGKEAVEFKHIWAFFVENAPTITDPQGKVVVLPRYRALGLQAPRSTKVPPGKVVELYGWNIDLDEGWAKHHGTGKFTFQCGRIVGPTSGNPIHPNPAFAKLATGKLNVEVKVAAPKQQGTRRQAAANLSVLMGALHKYHDDPRHGRLPPAVIMGKDGKGGVPHSWRVEILPYLGQKALYDAYRFDEPWDSKHNKGLIARMPAVFRSPRDEQASTYASYFALVTPGLQPAAAGGGVAAPAGGDAAPLTYDHGTVFSNPTGTRLTEIPDGTSNVVALVEARRVIHWTQPEDIRYFADQPLPKLGQWFPQGWHAGFADKEVKMLSPDNDETTIRRLFTIGDGYPTKPKFVR